MKTPHLIALTLGGGIALGAVSSRILHRPPSTASPAAAEEAVREHPASRGISRSDRKESPNPARPEAAFPSTAAQAPQSLVPAKAGAFPSVPATTPPESTAAAAANAQTSARTTIPGNSSPAAMPAGASTSAYSSLSAGVAASSSGGPAASSPGRSAASGNSAGSAESSAPEPSEPQPADPASDLPIPVGTIAPAVYYDAEVRSPQQQAALDRIAAEFEENVANAGTEVSQEENWQAARKVADDRYLTLFGYQAYNQYHLQAAKEAVKELKATAAPVPAETPANAPTP